LYDFIAPVWLKGKMAEKKRQAVRLPRSRTPSASHTEKNTVSSPQRLTKNPELHIVVIGV
jgi:hypothetical protein